MSTWNAVSSAMTDAISLSATGSDFTDHTVRYVGGSSFGLRPRFERFSKTSSDEMLQARAAPSSASSHCALPTAANASSFVANLALFSSFDSFSAFFIPLLISDSSASLRIFSDVNATILTFLVLS